MKFLAWCWTSLGRAAALAGSLLMLEVGMASADVLDDIAQKGVVKIGIFQDFPPFASLGPDLKVQGYDTEIADKIAQAVGAKAELVGITGQNRIPYLTEGKVDLLLSIGYSDERAKVVTFTDPYAPYYISVMGPSELDVKGAADLKGKTIEATKIAPEGADIQRYNDYNGVISAFLSGQAQLMVVGNDVGATILAKNPSIKPVEKFQLLTSPSHMGVKKGETRLKDKLNTVIAGMKKDGSLNELSLKWLKQPLPKDF
jgi:polar amino acid transport system substrate-binding protein